MRRALLVIPVLAACLPDDEATTSHSQQAAAAPPWKQASKWPYSIESPRMIVHYQATGDLAMAQTVLVDVEDAWTKQVTQGGARPPLPDNGTAGPDGRFDVWLQRGIDSMYVASITSNPATSYNDAFTSMVLDPWGQYGGVEQRPNIFHEFRHGSQGTDDWFEHIEFFEAEATAWEVAYYGHARLPYVWTDYQAHPEWSPFKDDHYATWFMYGGALFLLHLREKVFNNSLAFTNDVWLNCRNGGSANEPDFADALNTVLAPKGTDLFSQIVAFDRNRWYTGSRANGTLAGAADVAEVATKSHVRASGAGRTSFAVGPELLGAIYTVVTKAPTDGNTLRVSLSNVDAKASPVVQLVGGGDAVLNFSGGAATVPVTNGKVVLVVTMLPSNGQFDPDTVGTQAYKATVNIDP